jgi:hypothetical protein
MTLEINEISIQISVSSSPQGSAAPLPSVLNTSTPWPGLQAEQLDQVVQRCVREVLRHLRLKERR